MWHSAIHTSGTQVERLTSFSDGTKQMTSRKQAVSRLTDRGRYTYQHRSSTAGDGGGKRIILPKRIQLSQEGFTKAVDMVQEMRMQRSVKFGNGPKGFRHNVLYHGKY